MSPSMLMTAATAGGPILMPGDVGIPMGIPHDLAQDHPEYLALEAHEYANQDSGMGLGIDTDLSRGVEHRQQDLEGAHGGGGHWDWYDDGTPVHQGDIVGEHHVGEMGDMGMGMGNEHMGMVIM